MQKQFYFIYLLLCIFINRTFSQKQEAVTVIKENEKQKVNVFIGGRFFTSFLYPDSLEKPVLFPLVSSKGIVVTRGYPLEPRPGESTDHPHHIGSWFNFENVNALDFWNNSFAIPLEKKQLYGWIRTDKLIGISSGTKGTLAYHASWTDQKKNILLEEETYFTFSGSGHKRIIDRITILKADTDVLFKDAKDGLLGIRFADDLQIPANGNQTFADSKGNQTAVNINQAHPHTGNYLTSEGKTGNDAWSSRGKWCKLYGKIGPDSVTIAIIDHPENPNYPTFWHARGYGLFAANPLGENIFTDGKKSKDLFLKKGASVKFRFRIIIQDGTETLSVSELNSQAVEFGEMR